MDKCCNSPDLVCRNCGTAHEDLLDRLQQQQEALDTTTIEWRKARAQINRLRGDSDAKMRQHKNFPVAIRILEKWKQLCSPGAVEITSGERVKSVMARLAAGYSEEQLDECIVGYARFPYVVNGRRLNRGTPAQRRIDAELLFRDPGHVDQGRAYAAEAERLDEAIPQITQTPKVISESTPELSNLGKAALRLAQFGFYVFPIAPRAKHPVTPNGLKDATRDEVRITTFWLVHPEHNIGIRCGVESGVIVLDVDGEEGLMSLRALEAKNSLLPRTASIVTPRGGSHYYFRHPGAGEIHNTASFPGPALDVRGDGGYVLGPPSVGKNGRAYEVDEQASLAEMPNWFLALLVNRQTELPAFSHDYAQWVQKDLREGARNNELTTYAGHLIAHGIKPDEVLGILVLYNSQHCKPPLPEREVRRVVESVWKRHQRKAQNTLRELISS